MPFSLFGFFFRQIAQGPRLPSASSLQSIIQPRAPSPIGSHNLCFRRVRSQRSREEELQHAIGPSNQRHGIATQTRKKHNSTYATTIRTEMIKRGTWSAVSQVDPLPMTHDRSDWKSASPQRTEKTRGLRLWLSHIPCGKSSLGNFDAPGKFLLYSSDAIPAKVWTFSGNEKGSEKIDQKFRNVPGFSCRHTALLSSSEQLPAKATAMRLPT